MQRALWISALGLALPLTVILLSYDSRAEDEPQADAATVEKLIAALSDDDFRTREEASQKLAALGERARPALERAIKASKSPELRWRAEQILRRLRGGDQEKPIGGPAEGQPTPSPAPGTSPKTTGSDLMREAMKKLENLFKDKRFAGGTRSPFGFVLGARRVTVPGLTLERAADGTAKLRVERENEQGAKVEDVYTGHSLTDILANNPKLTEHAGMAELKRREAETNWPGLEDFRRQLGGNRVHLSPFRNGGIGITTSSGVEIQQDADGVTVKLRERDKDGKETIKEFKGKTIEELKEKHPELKDKIGSLSFRVSPPQVFWPGFRPQRLNPLQPPVTPLTPRARTTGRAVFGLTLTDVSEALASHLGLAKHKGALVDNVLPGSQAEALGIQRNDIVLKVGAQEVGLSEAADLLRKAGTERGALSVELIRGGKPVTLTR